MRIEVRADGGLRHVQASFAAQRGNQLRGQEMRVDHQGPSAGSQERLEFLETQLLDGESQSVAMVATRAARLVEPIVDISDDMRQAVDQVEICLAVDAAKHGVGEL